MKETTSQLLAYSKESLLAGDREFKHSTGFARMQAILRWHDAIEFCLRAAISEHKINHDRKADFDVLQKAINQHFAPKQLPLASQVDFLNNARGKIKHHASVPSEEDTNRCQVYAREFLEQVTKDYLKVDFETISRITLIENESVRKALEEAENYELKAEYLEALISAKKAFYLAKPSDRVYLSRNDPIYFASFSELGPLYNAFEQVAHEIQRLEETLALMMMGVDMGEYKRFNEITPFVYFIGRGQCQIYWDSKIIPTREMASEARNFVIDTALLWQIKGILAYRPDTAASGMPSARMQEIRSEKWG